MIEWRCKNDHVLGWVLFGKTSRLMLLNDTGEIIAIISGKASVRCPVCCEIRIWRSTIEHLRFIAVEN